MMPKMSGLWWVQHAVARIWGSSSQIRFARGPLSEPEPCTGMNELDTASTASGYFCGMKPLLLERAPCTNLLLASACFIAAQMSFAQFRILLSMEKHGQQDVHSSAVRQKFPLVFQIAMPCHALPLPRSSGPCHQQ